MINRDQNFLVGEWNLEAISGNVRGDVWWHANNARSDENAREEQGDDGFGKLKYTCDDDDEINSPKNASKRKKKKTKKKDCLLYTSPSPRDRTRSRMPSSA